MVDDVTGSSSFRSFGSRQITRLNAFLEEFSTQHWIIHNDDNSNKLSFRSSRYTIRYFHFYSFYFFFKIIIPFDPHDYKYVHKRLIYKYYIIRYIPIIAATDIDGRTRSYSYILIVPM